MPKKFLLIIISFVLISAVFQFPSQANAKVKKYKIVDISRKIPGFKNYAYVYASKINRRNDILIGAYEKGITDNAAAQFVYRKSKRLYKLCNYCKAADINDAGTIVGYTFDQGAIQKAMLWNVHNTAQDLSTRLGESLVAASAINNQGVLTFPITQNDQPATLIFDPTTNQKKVIAMDYVAEITDGTFATGLRVLGGYTWVRGYTAKIWNSQTNAITDIPALSSEAGFSVAADINNKNQVVGYSAKMIKTRWGNELTDRAFRWTPAQGTRDLKAYRGDIRSYASAINIKGTIVGESISIKGNDRAYYKKRGQKIRLLPRLAGGVRSYARDINIQGRICGYAWDRNRKIRPVYWLLK